MLPSPGMVNSSDGVKPGIEVGGYLVEALVGWGSVATVYRVRRVADGTLWAMKVLEPSGALEQRFEREGRIQQVLDHPNLVRVHEIMVIDGLHALIMDLVDGPPLGKWISDNRPSFNTAVELIHDIALGVQEIHRAGLVHRDLTPANVLIHTEVNGKLVPKVTDFGLAKRLDTFTGGTLVGTAMGTPTYAAPEQLKDASSVDQRVDTYAIGAMFYEILVGQGPFAGLDAYDLRLAQRDATWEPVSAKVPGLPEGVDKLISELIVYDPDKRISKVSDVIARIGGFRPKPVVLPRQSSAWVGVIAMPVIALVLGAIVAIAAP